MDPLPPRNRGNSSSRLAASPRQSGWPRLTSDGRVASANITDPRAARAPIPQVMSGQSMSKFRDKE